MTDTSDDVQQLLDTDPAGLWVAIDVAMEALDVKRRRAYQLAKSEGWRTQGGGYSFHDIRRTWKNRRPTP